MAACYWTYRDVYSNRHCDLHANRHVQSNLNVDGHGYSNSHSYLDPNPTANGHSSSNGHFAGFASTRCTAVLAGASSIL